MKITIDGQAYDVEVRSGEVVVGGKSFPTRSERSGNQVVVEIGGKTRQVELQGDTVLVDGKSYAVVVEGTAGPAPMAASQPRPAPAPRVAPPRPAQAASAVQRPAPPPRPAPAAPPAPEAAPTGSATVIQAPMPGKILRVLASEGEKVPLGGVLLVLEAMKMENEIRATVGGVVKSLPVSAGAAVNAGDPLAIIEG